MGVYVSIALCVLGVAGFKTLRYVCIFSKELAVFPTPTELSAHLNICSSHARSVLILIQWTGGHAYVHRRVTIHCRGSG